MMIFSRLLRLLPLILLALPNFAGAADDLAARLLTLQEDWARTNYEVPATEQNGAFERLTADADALITANPDRAEPLVWKAIIESTHAGVIGGLGALGKVKDARDLLLRAEAIDQNTLEGSVYTSLGSLYYKVPGWPLGFGDKKQAETYLKKALEINPDGIDPNFFYGEFLYEQGRGDDAVKFLDKALAAKPRPGRPVADQGRREEAASLLQKIEGKQVGVAASDRKAQL